MPEQVTFTQRLHYRVDNFLARGSGALFLSLLVAFLGSIVALALVRLAVHLVAPDASEDALRHVWTIFLELTDPGNMGIDTDTHPGFKAVAILTGITGVVIFSALIAFITTALDQAIAGLKRGHSRVLESGHTLILGWGPRVVEILRELVEANESEDHPAVVVLAEEEKEAIDEYLQAHFTDRRNTKLVTRSGTTSSLASLQHVNAAQCKSAIVLASCSDTASEAEKAISDAKTIKTVLALDAIGSEGGEGADFPMVAEVFDPRNRQVIMELSPGRVVAIDTRTILAKLMVQTSRTSGLSVVYSELLSFEGCEIYFHGAEWGEHTFGELQYHFPDGVPIGLRHADGSLTIRPAPETPIEAGDEVLIVATDDSTIEYRPRPVMQPEERPVKETRLEQHQERQLIVGWGPKAPTIITEYADYVLEGSKVDVLVAHPDEATREAVRELDASLEGLEVTLIEGDPLDRDVLARVRPFDYHNVTILPHRAGEHLDAERIDAETILVLLNLRRLLRDAGKSEGIDTKIITEVIDSENQELVSQAGVNDFIISDRMISMIFAQISEEPDIKKVYDDLFEEEGSEIYVKPIGLYCDELPISCRFGDLMRAAQKRDGEVCIGFKLGRQAHDSHANFGVRLIPPKDETVTLGPGDGLVVVAEDDR
ncbi:MAG: hypothetical protein P1V51_11655 [Deltaproteobacteria bacterium]|nr:hypothetical protein [Deltaproteobacteria bacterium]